MTKKPWKPLRVESPRKNLNRALWTLQGVLALLFLWAGAMKLLLPIEAMTAQIPLPGLFLRFIGVAEVSGAVGLILPGLLRFRQGLTPLAALGLAIVMTGATVLTLATAGIAPALIPLTVGMLAALVACGRRVPASQEKSPAGGRSGRSSFDLTREAA